MGQVLDDSNPPFYKWFRRRPAERVPQLPGPPRRGRARRSRRLPLARRDGEEREITYAGLLADVERFANALKDLGIRKGDIVGIYLPMIPEVAVAMLACARIGAPHNVVFGWLRPRSGPRADGVLGGEGADHSRRRVAQGQTSRRSRRRSTS